MKKSPDSCESGAFSNAECKIIGEAPLPNIVLLLQIISDAELCLLIRIANGEGDRDGAMRSRGGREFQ